MRREAALADASMADASMAHASMADFERDGYAVIDALEFSPARVAAARADLGPWMERSALKNYPMQLLC